MPCASPVAPCYRQSSSFTQVHSRQTGTHAGRSAASSLSRSRSRTTASGPAFRGESFLCQRPWTAAAICSASETVACSRCCWSRSAGQQHRSLTTDCVGPWVAVSCSSAQACQHARCFPRSPHERPKAEVRLAAALRGALECLGLGLRAGCWPALCPQLCRRRLHGWQHAVVPAACGKASGARSGRSGELPGKAAATQGESAAAHATGPRAHRPCAR